jgi:UDP-N-acetylmuramoyl-L-alanyl-D-glutamate--2,6-diaminopimelate ligase
MMLSELTAGLPVAPPPAFPEADAARRDPQVTGVTHDSRRVSPGDLFVACVGGAVDGRRFAPQAVTAGAVAVLAPEPAPDPASDGPWRQVPWWTAAEPHALLAPLAARAYGHPERELTLVGITGTNGKTTLVALVAAILGAAGERAGAMGTLGFRLAGELFPGESSTPTTPEAPDFYATLRRMRDAGATAVAMEVSSHALVQGRVAGAGYRVAAFTNLSRDHFDFHAGFEDYYLAKRKLFDQLTGDGVAVLPTGDTYGRRLAAELRAAGAAILTWGEGGDVAWRDVELTGAGTRGTLATPRGEYRFETPLIGRYNLLNLTAAAAVAEALELPHAAVVEALAAQRPVRGRLEAIDAGQRFPAYVDYAHTDGALEAALAALRELDDRKILLVFGCGGDRDPGKRALMGEVAGRLADHVILTSDNPRSEDPLAILAAVEQGLAAAERPDGTAASYEVEPDRRAAIRRAVALADAGSAVLVAGKGHEAEQIVGGRRFVFSDHDELRAALEASLGSRRE